MGECLQHALLYLGHERLHGGLAHRADPQRNGVDEQADRAPECAGAAGHGDTDDQIVLATAAAHEDAECAREHGEQRLAVGAREGAHRLGRQTGAMHGDPPWSRLAGAPWLRARQQDLVGRAGERPTRVRDIARARRSIGLRVLGVRHVRGLRPGRADRDRASGQAMGCVAQLELAAQEREGLAIHRDVMERADQHVKIVGAPVETRADERPALEIEGLTGKAPELIGHDLAPGAAVGSVHALERDARGTRDPALDALVGLHEHGAQTGVGLDQIAEGALEGVGIQPARERELDADVVRRLARMELFDEPESSLLGRQRPGIGGLAPTMTGAIAPGNASCVQGARQIGQRGGA
ncbi:MAG TPA: hypothetical protein VFD36_19490 [Kofleriaceae bacterium]|nr:hypothetical protein [Kofleriaceae bacterium]